MLLLMEKPQELTCILCKKRIPAKAHIHHCENGNPVEVVKIFLGDEAPEHLNIKNPKNAFAVRADVSITVKCSACNKNDVSVIKNVWKMCSDISDGKLGEYQHKAAICDDCTKSKKAEELRIEKETRLEKERLNKYYESPQYLADCIAAAKRRDKEYRETGIHATQCEYCGKVFDLTKEDFLEHQNVCKADNAQI